MAESEPKVWLVSRHARSTPFDYVAHSLGEAAGIYFGLYLLYLLFREIGIEFPVFCAVFVVALLTRMGWVKSKSRRRLEAATGSKLPVKGDVKARAYMVMFFAAVVIASNDHPLVADNFEIPEDSARVEWLYFLFDNLLKAIILDFFEIFGFGMSRIEPLTRIGDTIVFILRSLVALAAFEFVRSRIREINVTEIFRGTKEQAIFHLNQSYINPETFQLTEITIGDSHSVPKNRYSAPTATIPAPHAQSASGETD